ncbi:hypothetical protein CSB45_10195 [candidate division KSB3 bacterium]|uniref:YdbS-like PH domain-containing protein n=1 Tax=candidate division KSB3 bacterium TaxID=2044937 RepID=A0A2G6E4X2_9BACT|nr:MAG: hypothetical protein CSB45_10195 [candidate division KSB3 bacterium]PIE29314.1 MAG: hypothetical protein CSA57_08895 [candidate division KSB3 bacterium]
MSEENRIFQGNIPFRAVHFSHSVWWLLLFGWNVGLLLSWLQCLGLSVQITTQRLVLSRGIVSKELEEVEFYRVKDTKYRQSLLQRILNIGTITLFSDDVTAPTLSFTIERPAFYREQIRSAVQTARREMGAIQVD